MVLLFFALKLNYWATATECIFWCEGIPPKRTLLPWSPARSVLQTSREWKTSSIWTKSPRNWKWIFHTSSLQHQWWHGKGCKNHLQTSRLPTFHQTWTTLQSCYGLAAMPIVLLVAPICCDVPKRVQIKKGTCSTLRHSYRTCSTQRTSTPVVMNSLCFSVLFL